MGTHHSLNFEYQVVDEDDFSVVFDHLVLHPRVVIVTGENPDVLVSGEKIIG